MSFFPPVGLQLLLRFVAERKSADPATEGRTPTHVAVLYVGMMVFGQILRGVTYGQALDIGRRACSHGSIDEVASTNAISAQICIRTRAILVADIFTKALRRRDQSGNVASMQEAEGKTMEEQNAVREREQEGKEASAPAANITNLIGVDAFNIGEHV